MKTVYRWLCATFGGLLLSACGHSRVTWTEEVDVGGAKPLLVQRTTVFKPGGDEIARNPRGRTVADFLIEVPGSKQTWRSTRHDVMGYPEVPLYLGLEQSIPTIYTVFDNSEKCGTYYRYQMTGAAWLPAPLQRDIDLATNLLLEVEPDRPHVALAEKAHSLRGGAYPQALLHVAPDRFDCTKRNNK
jgi:hypothetical protein